MTAPRWRIERRVLLVEVESLFEGFTRSEETICGIETCDRGDWRSPEGNCRRLRRCPHGEVHAEVEPLTVANFPDRPLSEVASLAIEKLYIQKWEIRYWSAWDRRNLIRVLDKLGSGDFLSYAGPERSLLMGPANSVLDRSGTLFSILGEELGPEIHDPRCCVAVISCDAAVVRECHQNSGGVVIAHQAPNFWWDVVAVGVDRLNSWILGLRAPEEV